jgi:hypothetical protein
MHDRISAQLTEVLGEVVGERIVVVENQDSHEMVPPESRSVFPIQSYTNIKTMNATIRKMAASAIRTGLGPGRALNARLAIIR